MPQVFQFYFWNWFIMLGVLYVTKTNVCYFVIFDLSQKKIFFFEFSYFLRKQNKFLYNNRHFCRIIKILFISIQFPLINFSFSFNLVSSYCFKYLMWHYFQMVICHCLFFKKNKFQNQFNNWVFILMHLF